jgi:hypothetical protein
LRDEFLRDLQHVDFFIEQQYVQMLPMQRSPYRVRTRAPADVEYDLVP